VSSANLTGPGAADPAGSTQPGPGAAPGTPAPALDVTRLRVAVVRLSRRLRKHELAGLTPTKLSALATVGRWGPIRLGDLAAAERIAPSTLTRLVSSLAEAGYVERSAVPGDARASTVSITEQGRAVLIHLSQESTTLLQESVRTLTGEQLTALAVALPALEQLAEMVPAGPENPPGPGLAPGSGPAAGSGPDPGSAKP
jgi:DNA-binding MarR family transcriptional regulator